MQEEYSPDILTVTDEEGTEHSFEVLDAIDHKEERYLAVVPVGGDEEEMLEEDLNLVIMKIVEEDGEEFLDVVDDDEEFYEVGDIFAERLSDLYDIDAEE